MRSRAPGKLRLGAVGGLLSAALVWCGAPLGAQESDYSALRINEVIADNESTTPTDVVGGTPDIVEIFNAGDDVLEIGIPGQPEISLALSDSENLPETPEEGTLWVIGTGQDNLLTVFPGESILVFCDGSATQAACEPHASFAIDAGGAEPITLWGPEVDGTREVIDRLWLPPLRADVSFGRYPDGAGPAPMPKPESLEDALDILEGGVFVLHPPGDGATKPTFGSCTPLPNSSCLCQGPSGTNCYEKRFCNGAPNNPGGNLEPRVFRATQSTNAPAAGEDVLLVAEVRDDLSPTPANITSVEIVYRVDGVDQAPIPMQYDSASGPQWGGPAKPLDVWTLWTGKIPASSTPLGSQVEFHLRVTDADAVPLSSTRPRVLCAEDVGPCDSRFGGPGCVLDIDPSEPDRVRYVVCDKPFTYAVGYEPRGNLSNLVINEICPSQTSLLWDATSDDPDLCSAPQEERPDYCSCTFDPPKPYCGFEDFIEIHNTSATESVDVSGLWLSDSYFHPRKWEFPDQSLIPPKAYVIVWLDDDGSKCPDPSVPAGERPGAWECPDPNDPAKLEFHTTFELSNENDQIFLYDNEENKFGLIHGLAFTNVPVDTTLSLCPDGSRNGVFEIFEGHTAKAPNTTSCSVVTFKRGDANADCAVDLTDGIVTLGFLYQGTDPPACPDAADADDNGVLELTDAVFTFSWLYSGGDEPPPPGPHTQGPDLQEEDPPLDPCVYEMQCP